MEQTNDAWPWSARADPPLEHPLEVAQTRLPPHPPEKLSVRFEHVINNYKHEASLWHTLLSQKLYRLHGSGC